MARGSRSVRAQPVEAANALADRGVSLAMPVSKLFRRFLADVETGQEQPATENFRTFSRLVVR